MVDIEDLVNLEEIEDLSNCLAGENDELNQQIKPKVQMKFNGIEELYEFYRKYAKTIVFPIQKNPQRRM